VNGEVKHRVRDAAFDDALALGMGDRIRDEFIDYENRISQRSRPLV
jgi:hypothetical protein